MDKEIFCGELYASNKEDQDDDCVLSTLRNSRQREVKNRTEDPNAISEKALPREASERETVGVPGLDHSIKPNKKPKLARDGRRKKIKESSNTVNDHPSVLDGLVLCKSPGEFPQEYKLEENANQLADFIPNDDISQARRIRISRVLKFGATRAAKFDTSVTHIVAERWLNYEDVVEYLQVSSVPVSLPGGTMAILGYLTLLSRPILSW